MKDSLAKQVKVYTVGTWAKDRDCLWNISKKPDIYDNAWLWPRIWQGNRDQIKDPDVIHQGQKLKIPGRHQGGGRLRGSSRQRRLGSRAGDDTRARQVVVNGCPGGD